MSVGFRTGSLWLFNWPLSVVLPIIKVGKGYVGVVMYS